MDLVGSILTAIFVATLIAVAVTFGFALFTFILCVAIVTSILVYSRELWYRWRFVRGAYRREQADTKIIEGEYQDISNDKK